MSPLLPVTDARARARVGGDGPPGAALAVFEDGREVFARGYGVRALDDDTPVDPDTAFGLASVSKVFSARLVLHTAAQGLLSLDDPVARWLPELRLPRVASIRVHHLLNHTSGLPGLPSRYHARCANEPKAFHGGARDVDASRVAGPVEGRYGFRDAEGLVAFLGQLDIEPAGAPGERVNYSNEGYGLLGLIVERATGRPYARALEAWLRDELGLEHCFAGDRPPRDCALAGTHHRFGSVLRSVAPWNVPAWYPAGGLCASPRAVARLLSDPRALDALCERVGRVVSSDEAYGFGVHVRDDDHGWRILAHDGTTDGKNAAFLVAPERRLVVVAMTNLDGGGAPELARTALCEALGLDPDTPRYDLEALQPRPEDDLDACAGTYANREGASLEIAREAQGLALVVAGRPVPCPWLGDDRIALGGAPARFLRRGGRVHALAVSDRILPRADG